MVLSSVVAALQKGEVRKSVELMQNWLTSAQPGEPERLIARCPVPWRSKLVLLMRDLLSRYPATILGAPVLVYCTEEDDIVSLDCRPALSGANTTRNVLLPYPSTQDLAQPCFDLHFLGWLPQNAQLPLLLPFQPERYPVSVPINDISAAVALFRSHPDVFELDQLELPNQWWGDLFQPVHCNVRISARMLLPYPDALEAARVLSTAARGEPAPARGGFLSDNGWAWARDAGELFQETCRQLYGTRI